MKNYISRAIGLLSMPKMELEDLARRELRGHPLLRFEDGPNIPSFSEGEISNTTADVIVISKDDGSWAVQLTPLSLASIVTAHAGEATSKALGESEALDLDIERDKDWLAEAIDKRSKFVLAVSEAVVATQDEFLRLGPDHFKLVTSQSVAEALNIHPSTVNRLANLQMATPHGTFALSFFFAGDGC